MLLIIGELLLERHTYATKPYAEVALTGGYGLAYIG